MGPRAASLCSVKNTIHRVAPRLARIRQKTLLPQDKTVPRLQRLADSYRQMARTNRCPRRNCERVRSVYGSLAHPTELFFDDGDAFHRTFGKSSFSRVSTQRFSLHSAGLGYVTKLASAAGPTGRIFRMLRRRRNQNPHRQIDVHRDLSCPLFLALS